MFKSESVDTNIHNTLFSHALQITFVKLKEFGWIEKERLIVKKVNLTFLWDTNVSPPATPEGKTLSRAFCPPCHTKGNQTQAQTIKKSKNT
jgi:hypothetical protein